MNTPTAEILSRLEGVRRAGCGWIARCPSHTDKTPSLSIAEGRDGRVLLHDFGGCAVIEVVAALGLTLADLFSCPRAADHGDQQRDFRQYAPHLEMAAILGVLVRESTIIAIAAQTVAGGRALQPDDLARLLIACARVDDCRAVLV